MVQSDWSLKTWGPTVKSWVYTDICVFPVYAFFFVFGKFPFSLESVSYYFLYFRCFHIQKHLILHAIAIHLSVLR